MLAIHCAPSLPRQLPHVLDRHALCSLEVGDYRVEGRALLNPKRTQSHRIVELGDVKFVRAWVMSSHFGHSVSIPGRQGLTPSFIARMIVFTMSE